MKMQQRNWKEDLKPYLPLRVQEMLASVDGECAAGRDTPARRTAAATLLHRL